MPTLTELRRATADRVAPFELARSGIGYGAGYVGTALGGSKRRIVSSDLVSLDALGTGPEAPQDALKGAWVYLLTDPPEQRRVPEAGFVAYAWADEAVAGFDPTRIPPDTPVAYLDVERPFSALVAAGTELELHGIPPQRGGRSAGLHAAINRALRVMLREDTVGVPGVSGTYVIDVTAVFPWLTLPGQFVAATYVETHAGLESWMIPGATLRFDADRTLLSPNTTVSSGQTLPVRVLRPLSTWVKPACSGVWAESTAGLVDEADECLGDVDAISLVAAFHVADAEAQACVVGSPEQAFWAARARSFAARSPFLRDQATRRPKPAAYPFPDFIAPTGPYGGRFGPGFR